MLNYPPIYHIGQEPYFQAVSTGYANDSSHFGKRSRNFCLCLNFNTIFFPQGNTQTGRKLRRFLHLPRMREFLRVWGEALLRPRLAQDKRRDGLRWRLCTVSKFTQINLSSLGKGDASGQRFALIIFKSNVDRDLPGGSGGDIEEYGIARFQTVPHSPGRSLIEADRIIDPAQNRSCSCDLALDIPAQHCWSGAPSCPLRAALPLPACTMPTALG